MTREEIENTDWAKEFKADAPSYYSQAIEYALQENLKIFINHNNEAVNWLYSIIVLDNPNFWMDAKETEEEAIELCNRMGWTII